MTNIVSGISGFFSTFLTFTNKYASELEKVASGLSTVVNAVPIDLQDKERVNGLVTELTDAVESIRTFVASAPTPSEIVIKESDLVTAISNFLNSDAGKSLLASLEGKGNA